MFIFQWLGAFQNGVYDLKSVCNNYESFLTAIGIPSFAVFFILRGSETIEMEILKDGSVKSKTITGDVNLDSVIGKLRWFKDNI